MLYDPDLDTVLELAPGQEHAGRTIESIKNGNVTIRAGRYHYTLSLDKPVAGSSK